MGFSNVYGLPLPREQTRHAGLLIDGRAIAAAVRSELAADVAAFAARTGRSPGLATLMVGDDPASAVYVAAKQRAAAAVGMRAFDVRLPADAAAARVVAEVERLNGDPAVDGVLCQLPVPAHLDGGDITGRVDPAKDVDGLTAASAGALASGRPGLRPCTPAGVMRLLEEAGVPLSGRHAVVVGRSNLFGKPMALMLLAADATVTVAHSRTEGLPAVCRTADVLVVAVGRPRMVGADWVKPGATVIDVGINRTDTGLSGDVDFDAVREVAGAITPVPGGVGPMTIAMLLSNTLAAAKQSATTTHAR